MPEISVIIPVYNKNKYLLHLWELLLGQTFEDYECLLIDDGSFDGSGQSCDDITIKDPRFKVFHIDNAGVSHARNLGLDYARGEYITFIDADDSFHKDYLKNLYMCIYKSGADMVISSSIKIWNGSDYKEEIKVPYVGFKTMAEIMDSFAIDQLSTGIYGYCWGKIICRKFIGTTRFSENIRLAEDLDFYLSIYPKVKSIYFDSSGYYYYLQAAENSSMQISDDKIDYFTQLQIQLKLYDFLNRMKGLCDESRELMITRIYDYIFFTLYHSPVNKIHGYCMDIRMMNLPKTDSVEKQSWQYKWIMGLFERKADGILIVTRKIYDVLRKMIRY